MVRKTRGWGGHGTQGIRLDLASAFRYERKMEAMLEAGLPRTSATDTTKPIFCQKHHAI